MDKNSCDMLGPQNLGSVAGSVSACSSTRYHYIPHLWIICIRSPPFTALSSSFPIEGFSMKKKCPFCDHSMSRKGMYPASVTGILLSCI